METPPQAYIPHIPVGGPGGDRLDSTSSAKENQTKLDLDCSVGKKIFPWHYVAQILAEVVTIVSGCEGPKDTSLQGHTTHFSSLGKLQVKDQSSNSK